MNRADTLRDALHQFGLDRQVDKAIEEMTELTAALLHWRQAVRYGRYEPKDAQLNLLEEMADVQIMLDQMKLAFGDPSNAEEVKLKALARKIEQDKERVVDTPWKDK